MGGHKRRAVVLGSNGLLGSHLVDALAREGYPVRAFDRYSRPPQHGSRRNIQVFRGDIHNADDIARVLDRAQLVFHFASTSTPVEAGQDPRFDLRTNVESSLHILSACVNANVERVYFASSGGTVYGTGRAVHRECDLPEPISPYGIGKLTIEHYLRFFLTVHGLHSVTLRMSNPYGARQKVSKRQGIVPIFLRAARDSRTVTVLGDGSMTRDYIYAPDLIDMIIRIVRNERPAHTVYNLGSGEGTSINAVLQTIREVSGRQLRVKHAAKPRDFVQDSRLDTSRFEREFGAPTLTSLSAGVRETWKAIEFE